ncbi:ABC-type transport auxiliary lipoprotein family protein [Candidatus Halobeggiatoa sp. HSG11]|nr:ABC-type transport auxiliary lipoprotein family protein [Candidatus Halobeggiatoa sp. HSG11]
MSLQQFTIIILLSFFSLNVVAIPKIYLFNVPLKAIPAKMQGDKMLLVSIPKAAPGFDTSALAYTNDGYEIKYHDGVQWADSPTRMLLPLLVHYLETSGKFKAVLSATTAPIASELRLDTEILRLQQEFFTEPSQVRLVLRVQLFDMAKRQVKSTQVFEIIENAVSKDAEGSIFATNEAVVIFLNKLVKFVINQL